MLIKKVEKCGNGLKVLREVVSFSRFVFILKNGF